jgi:hypothetical protein
MPLFHLHVQQDFATQRFECALYLYEHIWDCSGRARKTAISCVSMPNQMRWPSSRSCKGRPSCSGGEAFTAKKTMGSDAKKSGERSWWVGGVGGRTGIFKTSRCDRGARTIRSKCLVAADGMVVVMCMDQRWRTNGENGGFQHQGTKTPSRSRNGCKPGRHFQRETIELNDG